jgi:phospholipase/carboxylesterase
MKFRLGLACVGLQAGTGMRMPAFAHRAGLLLGLVASVFLAGCDENDLGAGGSAGGGADYSSGRLEARPSPKPPEGSDVPVGLQELGSEEHPHWLYVPEDYDPERPPGFVLALHGSGGSGRKALRRIESTVRAERAIALAPKSRGHSWDLVYGDFGEDVAEIDRQLEYVFERYAIDPRRVGVQGFSDGASYGLSLGLANGDLFRHIVVSSPGFMELADRFPGPPEIFITHGTDDPVLPVEQTREEFVAELEERGYEVTFREFDGGHGMPNALVPEMLDWLGPPSP